MTAAAPNPARRPLPRPRLLARLEPARVGLIEAGSGFGKTTLARDCARELGQAWAYLGLVPGDAEPGHLVRRLARALRASGLSDAAALVQQAEEPDDAVDGLVDALPPGADPLLLVVDEVQHAGPAGGALLARMARELPAGHRLWLVGRRLPAPCAELRRLDDAVSLVGEDLAFTADEAAALLARGGQPPPAPGEAEALVRATGGWAVALVLAAAGEESPSAGADGPGLVRALVDHGLHRLAEPDRAALTQLVHLPLLLPAYAGEITGRAGVLEAAIAAGLPFASLHDGQLVLPDPVREHLTGLGPLDDGVALRAAEAYARLGETMLAFDLLARVDDHAAAALLADLAPEHLEQLDVAELSTAVESLSAAAIAAHPRVLVHLARTCEPAARVSRRRDALAAALELAGDDGALRREIEAELARDLARDLQAEEAEGLARKVLEATGPGELPTRARALDVVGRVRAWRRDPASLATAEPMLEEAYRLCLTLGRRSWAAQVVMPLAIHVHYACARHATAVERLDEALAGLPARSRHRAVMLAFRADVLVDCGRTAEARASLTVARALAERLRDPRAVAYTWWSEARAAAYADDAQATLAALRRAEDQHGDWFDHYTGAELLADGAELLGRAGEPKLAWSYLARAEARHPQAESACALARATLTARFGDPVEAEALLAAVGADLRLEARERWRIELLRAHAAHRRGDARSPQIAAEAFRLAAAVDGEALPYARERVLAEQLWQDRDGGAPPPVRLTLLGRFDLSRGGPLQLPPGLPTQLVKLVACVGGRLPADAAMEALWPEVEPASGRKRLRNVLNRLRETAGELVLRDGDTLALDAGAEVDAAEFESAALRALSSRADVDGAAQAALVRYGGELLPDDRYEPWTAEPRERLARRHLALLDLLADQAEAQGEVDEALRLLERAISADRLDESRYLRSARLLLAQGRRGRALDVLRAAAGSLRDLGLEPSAEHRALVKATRS